MNVTYLAHYVLQPISGLKHSNTGLEVYRTVMEILSLNYFGGNDRDFEGVRDVIGHVTTGLAMCGFLYMFNYSHRGTVMEIQSVKFRGSRPLPFSYGDITK